MRAAEPKPGAAFDNRGRPNTGYLFRLSAELGRWIEAEYGATFDEDVALLALQVPAALAASPAGGAADDLLRSLIGVDLHTATGQLNRIVGVRDEVVLVATDRSPGGRDVEIRDVQAALDKLQILGEVVVTPEELGYRSAFIGAVLLSLPGTEAAGSPPVIRRRADSDLASAASFEGGLQRLRMQEERGEQGQLRRRLLGDAAVATCALCGELYPVGLLVAAHIKRRSVCSDLERRDLQHIAMLACAFGCDLLFELGYLTVETDGLVSVTSRVSEPGGLHQRLETLRNRPCTAYTEGSAQYFEWHRLNVYRF
jgi:hypothetical protein